MGRLVYGMNESLDLRIDEERHRVWMWTAKPTVLVSRTRQTANHNTTVIGGAALATQLMRAGLLDERVLATHPTVLGFGRTLFDDYDRPVDLELREQQTVASGVTMQQDDIRAAHSC